MNKNHQNNSESAKSPNDLSWLAFCYVANELDAEARRQFEIRLEHDQIARDAVVHAFEDTRLLDLALGSTDLQVTEPTCELANRESRSEQRSKPGRSRSLLPKALLGIAAAGLLAMAFTQLPWNQAGTEIAQNTGNFNQSTEFTDASISLAETWADSDWQTDLQVEFADLETNLTCDTQPSCPPEPLENIDQDDWMTATLIDMADEVSPQSGS